MGATSKPPFRLKANAKLKPSPATTVEEVAVIQTPEPIEEVNSLEPYSVVNAEKVFRHIDYGDGYNGTVYKFSRKISYEEFVEFCNSKELRLDKLDSYAWYEDHAAIIAGAIKNGSRWNTFDEGKPGVFMFCWTYLWIRAYTD